MGEIGSGVLRCPLPIGFVGSLPTQKGIFFNLLLVCTHHSQNGEICLILVCVNTTNIHTRVRIGDRGECKREGERERLPSVPARARPSNVCSLPKGHLQSTSNGLSQFQSLYLTLQLSTPRR